MAWVKRAALIAVVLLVLGLIVYGFLPKPLGVDLARAAIGPMTVTVDDRARTRVRDRFTLCAPASGELQRISLKPGDEVKAGAVVAVLLPAPPQLLDVRTRPQLEARARAADSAREQAKERAAATTAARDLAKFEDERQKKLQGTAGYSKELAERAAQQLRMAEADLRSAEFGVLAATHEAEAARAALEGGAADAPLELRSPVAGRVLRVFEESTRTVPAGAPLVEIGDPRALEIVADMLSSAAVKLHEGARVYIERWGGETLNGRVRRIEPSGFTKVSALGVDEQRVNVLIDLTDPPQAWAALGDGFAVEVRVVLWESPGVLRTPLGAIFRHGEGWAVFVVTGGRAELRPVKTGMRNGREAQILEGLTDGETVILHPGDTVRHDAAVTAREPSSSGH